MFSWRKPRAASWPSGCLTARSASRILAACWPTDPFRESAGGRSAGGLSDEPARAFGGGFAAGGFEDGDGRRSSRFAGALARSGSFAFHRAENSFANSQYASASASPWRTRPLPRGP